MVKRNRRTKKKNFSVQQELKTHFRDREKFANHQAQRAALAKRRYQHLPTKDLPFTDVDAEPLAFSAAGMHRTTNPGPALTQEYSYSQPHYLIDSRKPAGMYPCPQPSQTLTQPSQTLTQPSQTLTQPVETYEVQRAHSKTTTKLIQPSVSKPSPIPVTPTWKRPKTWRVTSMFKSKSYRVSKEDPAVFRTSKASVNPTQRDRINEACLYRMGLSNWQTFNEVLSKITKDKRKDFLLNLSEMSKTKYQYHLKQANSKKGISDSYLENNLTDDVDSLIAILSEPRNPCIWQDAIDVLNNIGESNISQELADGMKASMGEV